MQHSSHTANPLGKIGHIFGYITNNLVTLLADSPAKTGNFPAAFLTGLGRKQKSYTRTNHPAAHENKRIRHGSIDSSCHDTASFQVNVLWFIIALMP
jgi:hypothetical protein